MGTDCFAHCWSLRYVEMNSLQVVKKNCFQRCMSLQRAQFQQVVSIESDAFKECFQLEELDLPSVKEIEEKSIISRKTVRLVNTKNFKDVPNQVQFLPQNKLLDRLQFTHIQLKHNCRVVHLYSNQLKEIPNDGLSWQPLQFVFIPNVKMIGRQSFQFCMELMEVGCKNLKVIQSNAFDHCCKLTSLNALNVENIGRYAFEHCYSLNNVCFKNVKILEQQSFHYCNNVKHFSRVEISQVMKEQAKIFSDQRSQKVGYWGRYEFQIIIKQSMKTKQRYLKYLLKKQKQ